MLASIAALFFGDEPIIVSPAPTVAELLALSLMMVIIPPSMVTNTWLQNSHNTPQDSHHYRILQLQAFYTLAHLL